MAEERRFYSSLTRIAPLSERPFVVEPIPRSEWATGDYVVAEVDRLPRGFNTIETPTGCMVEVTKGSQIVGALGDREATLEVTGTWRDVEEDGCMSVLTSAGLLGKLTSRSPFMSSLISVAYRGHVCLEGEKATMRRFVPPVPSREYAIPTVLMTGTSMSAGKTSAAKVIVRQLKRAGLKVLGAKLTGAGRYRDIQQVADAGADWIYDFVDVGLPSTVVPEDEYVAVLHELLSMMAAEPADVAVVEIGSSPLEPYNGEAAIEAIEHAVQCTVLAASDPYAVYGVMQAFRMEPDIVCGIATNTHAGIRLIEKLCGVTALNVMEPEAIPDLNRILSEALGCVVPKPVS